MHSNTRLGILIHNLTHDEIVEKFDTKALRYQNCP